MSTTVTILDDIYSAWRRLYACKGEVVSVVAIHGNVLIVEGMAGRFPVNENNVKQNP